MTTATDTSREAVERHKDTARNLILNRALIDLDNIINNHDPDVDTSINNEVWDRLDKMALEIEREAVATLLAERDAALLREKSLKDSTEELRQLRRELNAVKRERDDLRAQLATARDAALEEVKRLADEAHKYHSEARNVQLALGNDDAAQDRMARVTTCAVLAADIDALKSTPAPRDDTGCIHMTAGMAENCPDCDGTGMRDSGGIMPWGEPAYAPCDCGNAPREVTPQEAARVLLPILDKNHIDFYTAKGRNPDDYSSKFSVASVVLRAIAQKGQSE